MIIKVNLATTNSKINCLKIPYTNYIFLYL